jgi:hypothetical protein
MMSLVGFNKPAVGMNMGSFFWGFPRLLKLLCCWAMISGKGGGLTILSWDDPPNEENRGLRSVCDMRFRRLFMGA